MQGLEKYPTRADNFGPLNLYYSSKFADPKMAEYDLITNDFLCADWTNYSGDVLTCAEGQIYDQMIIQDEDMKGNVWTLRSDYCLSYVVDKIEHYFDLTIFLTAEFEDGVYVDSVEDFSKFSEVVWLELFASDEWAEEDLEEEVIA